MNQSEFQIDCLLITNRKIYFFEAKNHNGDYYFKDGKWYFVITGKEISNPIHQLKRSELLLQQLLQKLNFNTSLDPYITFVNDGFFLYQAPFDQSLIFPTQLRRFIKKLNNDNRSLQERHKHLAEQLVLHNKPNSKYGRIPDFHYGKLKKGIACKSCTKLLNEVNVRRILRCIYCAHEEKLENAITRSLAEFHLLFPKERITMSIVKEWCNLGLSKD